MCSSLESSNRISTLSWRFTLNLRSSIKAEVLCLHIQPFLSLWSTEESDFLGLFSSPLCISECARLSIPLSAAWLFFSEVNKRKHFDFGAFKGEESGREGRSGMAWGESRAALKGKGDADLTI